MTRKDAISEWRDTWLPHVKGAYEQDGLPDYPARSESWGAYTDNLCRDDQITERQYNNWSAPRECGR